MKVLIACENSQRVLRAFRAYGHDVYSCDLKATGGDASRHIIGDPTAVVNGRCAFITQCGDVQTIDTPWDMVISTPRISILSIGSRVLSTYSGRSPQFINTRVEVVAAKQYWRALFDADSPRVAVVCPVIPSVFNLPTYAQLVQPYQFGHAFAAPRGVWLRGLPLLEPTDIVQDKKALYRADDIGFEEHTAVVGYKWKEGERTPAYRKEICAGVAEAMAMQWGSLK